jgi:hypothetical protein
MSQVGFATNILRRARKTNYNVMLTAEEVEFALGCEQLNNDQKILWLMLVCTSANDHSLSCTIEIKTKQMIDDLLALRDCGFLALALDVPLPEFKHLQYEDVRSMHCTIMLPNAGLLAVLKNAPAGKRRLVKYKERSFIARISRKYNFSSVEISR